MLMWSCSDNFASRVPVLLYIFQNIQYTGPQVLLHFWNVLVPGTRYTDGRDEVLLRILNLPAKIFYVNVHAYKDTNARTMLVIVFVLGCIHSMPAPCVHCFLVPGTRYQVVGVRNVKFFLYGTRVYCLQVKVLLFVLCRLTWQALK